MPFRVGPIELIIVLVIIMMVFGIGKLPQVGRSLGKGMKEFRKAQSEIDDLKGSLDITKDVTEDQDEHDKKNQSQ